MTEPEKTKLTTLLDEIAKANRVPNVILRGLLNGLFTAIGATIAFALVIFLFTQLYSGVRGIPFLKGIMDATGLSTVVDYALEQVNKAGDAAEETIKENDEAEKDAQKLEDEKQLQEQKKKEEDANNINNDMVVEVPEE